MKPEEIVGRWRVAGGGNHILGAEPWLPPALNVS